MDKSSDSRHSIIKRALQEGSLVSIRRDLYLIKNHLKHPIIDTFEISPIIYGPSYISFESALSYHGWIPEAVKTTTSATIKRTKEFETPLGIFSYEHIPIKAFPLGIGQHQKDDLILFIADPWKALADTIYAKRRTWTTINDLSEDLRIEPESLENSNKKLLEKLTQNYPSSRVKNTLQILQKGLSL